MARGQTPEETYETSVADYFAQKFKQALKFPDAHLVCVKQGKDEKGNPRLNFFPPEL
jgi:hypothetical protein